MRVYHFINAGYGLKDLKEKRLKITLITELNDPFEFLVADLSDRGFRKTIMDMKRSLSRSKGILCFSRSWNNPVQWAHYAEKHKGLCFGFDVLDCLLSKVDYIDERRSYRGEADESLTIKFLLKKYSDWKYEEEYRILLQLKDKKDKSDGLYYESFSDSLKLKQVIVGAYSKITRPQIKDALGDMSLEVEVFKARAAFRSFKIVRNKNEKSWT